MTISIGDKFYIFDINNRVYENRQLVYKKHFVEVTVFDETSRSWLIGRWENECHLTKYKKSDPFLNSGGVRVLYTADQVDDDCWANEHQYKIAQMVERASVESLKKIAVIVGYILPDGDE